MKNLVKWNLKTKKKENKMKSEIKLNLRRKIN